MLWYTREFSVAVYVSNLPMIWPLMREYIPFLRSLTSVGGGSLSKPSHGANMSGGFGLKTIGSSRSRVIPQDGITTTIRGKDEEDFDTLEVNDMKHIHRQGSEDPLRPGSDPKSSHDSSSDDIQLVILAQSGIHVDTTVQVTEEHIRGPPPAFDGGYGPYRSRRAREADDHQPAFEWQFENARR